MKATLTFTLPEEREEFETAQKGAQYKTTLDDLDNYLRSKTKYEDLPENIHEIYDSIRDQMRNFGYEG